ncbi:MAG: hypothetical protein QXT73_00455 [Candidatus Methanomethylicaceae archaeon]
MIDEDRIKKLATYDFGDYVVIYWADGRKEKIAKESPPDQEVSEEPPAKPRRTRSRQVDSQGI